jgi:hypothetical protein
MTGTYQARDGRVFTDGYVLIDGYVRDARRVEYPDGSVVIEDFDLRALSDDVAETFGEFQPKRNRPQPRRPEVARYQLTLEIERDPDNEADAWAPTTFAVAHELAERLAGKDLGTGWRVAAVVHGGAA